jgi:hypothetical protein
MPLPKKTIRVFPNPWGFIHHETGPQGHCHEDTGGRGSNPRYIGCEICPDKTAVTKEHEKDGTGWLLNEQITHFRFPCLKADLVTPAEEFAAGIELPKTPYYLDRLRDGDLIPADERSGEHGCRFATLAEARAAGIAAFEAHYDEGSFAAVCPALAEPVTVAATPDAKAARAARPVAPSAPASPAADSGAAK